MPTSSAAALDPVWLALKDGLGADFGHPLFFALFVIATVISIGIVFTAWDVFISRNLSGRDAVKYLLITLPAYVAVYALIRWVPMPFRLEVPDAAPGVGRFVLELAVCLVVADVASYWWHRLEHGNKWLFRKVHHVHHAVRSPLTVWSGFYLHPVEPTGVFVAFYAFPLIAGVHPLSLAAFAVLSTFITMVTHCGYDLPLYPNWLFASGPMHEHHHGKGRPVNFSVLLTLSDKLFGTFRPFAAQ